MKEAILTDGEVMEAIKIFLAAYAHASDNGRLPVTPRQLFYACREKFCRRKAG